MVAKARRILDAPPGYLAQVKRLPANAAAAASGRSTAWKKRSRCWAAGAA